MLRISHVMLCVGLVFGFVGCRASFQDIQKQGFLSSGDDLGAKGDDGTKKDDGKGEPDYPTLENVKELPPEDSESYGCDGIVVITESGKDKNLDGILQPTEVTDIKTECRPNTPPGGKDPKDPKDPPKCPNQNDGKGDKGKCPDDDHNQNDPGQNDPSQNDPSQSGKK
jgi:hypothetical protein